MAIVFRDIVYSGRINIFGLSNANYFEARPKIDFDATQWTVANFGIVVNATQTSNPTILPTGPQLETSATYGGRVATVKLVWSTFDWDKGKSGNDLETTLNPAPGQELVLRSTYKIGINAVTEVTCLYTITVQIGFVSIVPNPTNEPGIPNPNPIKEGYEKPEVPGFFAGLGTGALIAGGAILLILVFRR